MLPAMLLSFWAILSIRVRRIARSLVSYAVLHHRLRLSEANPMRAELRVKNGRMLFGRFETHLEDCARGAGEHDHAFGRQSRFGMARYP